MLCELVDEVGEDDAAATRRDVLPGLDRELLRLRPSLGGAERRERIRYLAPVDPDARGPSDAALAFAFVEGRHSPPPRSLWHKADWLVPNLCHQKRRGL